MAHARIAPTRRSNGARSVRAAARGKNARRWRSALASTTRSASSTHNQHATAASRLALMLHLHSARRLSIARLSAARTIARITRAARVHRLCLAHEYRMLSLCAAPLRA